tara:strand:+ start:25386 stop:26537 length:1152 start_codon:yes stop_codon:yes gene_type:complete
MKTVIYPLSADPITYGHLEIIKKVSNIFDNVIVLIASNDNKQHQLPISEREKLTRDVIEDFDLKNVKVDITGDIIDYLYDHDYKYLVRGIRNMTDFEYEANLEKVYKSNIDDLEIFYLKADKNDFVSSSTFKNLHYYFKICDHYVPARVLDTFDKEHHQKIIGVTGNIASGKSYFLNLIKELEAEQILKCLPNKKNYYFYNLDDIAKELLYGENKSLRLNNKLKTIMNEVNKDNITQLILSQKENFKDFNFFKKELVFAIKNYLNKEFKKVYENRRSFLFDQNIKKDVFIIEGALIFEYEMQSFLRNNIIRINGQHYEDKYITQREKADQESNNNNLELMSLFKQFQIDKDKMDLSNFIFDFKTTNDKEEDKKIIQEFINKNM